MQRSNIYEKTVGRSGTILWNTLRHAIRRTRWSLVWIGLASAFIAGGQGVAQTQPTGRQGGDRLTVRPHEMATGVDRGHGLSFLDSAREQVVYVPQQCGTGRRCPLVVSLGSEAAFGFNVVGAEKYGMIVLSIGTRGLDNALKQILREYMIDPDKIALMGLSGNGGSALHVGLANPDVFSRVVVLGFQWPEDTITGSRSPANEFFVAAGIRDYLSPLTPVSQVRSLRQAGHPVKSITGFYNHWHYAEQYALLWRLLSESWAIPNPAARPGPQVVADPLPELSYEVLAKMTTFWDRFQEEPDSIRTTARMTHQREVAVPFGPERLSATMMDLPALAAAYPSVAADLKAAHMTAQEHEAYRVAFLSASLMLAADRSSRGGNNAPDERALSSTLSLLRAADTTQSVFGKNVAFLRKNQNGTPMLEFVETKMWNTP